MSVMKELHSEITRLARKEIKKELEPVKRVNAAQRGLIAKLRKDVGVLQKDVARLERAAGKVVVAEVEETKGFWISGKGVMSLRKRLGITQMELAALAEVSHQSIVRWEKAVGKIPFKTDATLATLQQIRSMNKKKAWAKLGKGKKGK